MIRVTIWCISLSITLAGCDSEPTTQPPTLHVNQTDPWKERLDVYRAEYEANRAKLLADWQTAVRAAKSRDLDADRLAADVSDLVRQVDQGRARLEEWNRDLDLEIQRRGLPPTAAASEPAGSPSSTR